MRQFLFFQRIGGITNFALAVEENQNITGWLAVELIHCIKNRLQLIGVFIFVFTGWPVTNFDRIRAA